MSACPKEGQSIPQSLKHTESKLDKFRTYSQPHTFHSNQAVSLTSLLINAETLASTERIMQEPTQVSRCWKRYQRINSKKNIFPVGKTRKQYSQQWQETPSNSWRVGRIKRNPKASYHYLLSLGGLVLRNRFGWIGNWITELVMIFIRKFPQIQCVKMFPGGREETHKAQQTYDAYRTSETQKSTWDNILLKVT